MTIYDAMEIMVNLTMAELQKPGQNADMCLISVMPGAEVPYDYGQEACGGMLWVRLTSANPSASFPLADVTVDNCGVTLAYPLEVGIMRPMQGIEVFATEAQLPTAANNGDAALQQILDLESMYRAIINLGDEVENVMPGIYTPLGPEGGVVGGKWTFSVGLV